MGKCFCCYFRNLWGLESVQRNLIFLTLFWYKIFVHWTLKLHARFPITDFVWIKQNSLPHFSIFLTYHVHVSRIENTKCLNTQLLPQQKSRPLVIHDAVSSPCPASKLGSHLTARSTLLDREGMGQHSGEAAFETAPDRGPWKKCLQRQGSYQAAWLFFPSCQDNGDLASGSSLPSLKQLSEVEKQQYVTTTIYIVNRPECLIDKSLQITWWSMSTVKCRSARNTVVYVSCRKL